MTQERAITEREIQVLKLIARGHPDRKMTMERHGVSAQVCALNWDEIKVAAGAPQNETYSLIAHLVSAGYIASGQQAPSLWERLKGKADIHYFWITAQGMKFLNDAPGSGTSDDGGRTELEGKVQEVKNILKSLGFTITPYGCGVAVVSLQSDYSPAETASYIALATFTLDAKGHLNDASSCIAMMGHVLQVGEVLKTYKNDGSMREEIFNNDMKAMFKVVEIAPGQLEWFERVMTDPMIKKRVANRNSS